MPFLQDVTPIVAERPTSLPFSSRSVMPRQKVPQPIFGKLFFQLSRAVGLATASIWNDIINKDAGQAILPGFMIQPTREWTRTCKSKDKKGEQESEKNRMYLNMHSEVCSHFKVKQVNILWEKSCVRSWWFFFHCVNEFFFSSIEVRFRSIASGRSKLL